MNSTPIKVVRSATRAAGHGASKAARRASRLAGRPAARGSRTAKLSVRARARGARRAARGSVFGARARARGAAIGARVMRRGGKAAGRAACAGGLLGGKAASKGGRVGAKAAFRGSLLASSSAGKGAKVRLRAIRRASSASSALGLLKSRAGSARVPRAGTTAGFVSGLTTMYFLDPSTGRRRRQVAREQAVKLLRRGGRETAAQGVAEGEVHEFRAERTQPAPQPDDVTLVDRVQSVIFRDPGVSRGSVIVNAENGVIYLRGEVTSPELAERMAFATRSVDGVLAVKNLLHLPGERSPTAEDTRNSP
jgi:hypothetical protein